MKKEVIVQLHRSFEPRNGSWKRSSMQFCGSLPRRDDAATFMSQKGATTAGSRKTVQSDA